MDIEHFIKKHNIENYEHRYVLYHNFNKLILIKIHI